MHRKWMEKGGKEVPLDFHPCQYEKIHKKLWLEGNSVYLWFLTVGEEYNEDSDHQVGRFHQSRKMSRSNCRENANLKGKEKNSDELVVFTQKLHCNLQFCPWWKGRVGNSVRHQLSFVELKQKDQNKKYKLDLISIDNSKGTQHAGTHSEKHQVQDETQLGRDASNSKRLLCKHYYKKDLRMWSWLVTQQRNKMICRVQINSRCLLLCFGVFFGTNFHHECHLKVAVTIPFSLLLLNYLGQI